MTKLYRLYVKAIDCCEDCGHYLINRSADLSCEESYCSRSNRKIVDEIIPEWCPLDKIYFYDDVKK